MDKIREFFLSDITEHFHKSHHRRSLKFNVVFIIKYSCINHIHHQHHHKYQVLDPVIRSVSRVTAARANASSVFQLFYFFVVCGGMISKGFGFVVFFASMKASSVRIHLSCLVCL